MWAAKHCLILLFVTLLQQVVRFFSVYNWCGWQDLGGGGGGGGIRTKTKTEVQLTCAVIIVTIELKTFVANTSK